MSSANSANRAKRPRLRRPRIHRVSAEGAHPGRRSKRLIVITALGLLTLIVVVVLIVRHFSSTPITASEITLKQAIRPLTVAFGQTPEGYWLKGVAEAPVTVIEYGDYSCPGCAAAFERNESTITNSYVNAGKIRYVFHDFPASDSPNAALAAQGARCAGDQGKYWSMHDVLYARQGEWRDDKDLAPRLKGYAQELDLGDTARFGRCLDNGKYVQAIQEAIGDGTSKGIITKPRYSVDGAQVDADGLRAAIDAALTAKGR